MLTFVVKVRARHAGSERSAEMIDDIVAYLLADYSFMSRRSLVRVLKMCCLAIECPQKKFRAVEIDLGGCLVPESVITSCVRGVQSFVSSASYKAGAFFTQGTMDCGSTAFSSSMISRCLQHLTLGMDFVVLVARSWFSNFFSMFCAVGYEEERSWQTDVCCES